MKSEWTKMKLSDIADFNPRETIKKGEIAKKISMDVLRPFYRDVPYYTEECFSGGTKFRNGDTIMARITPCLENGKTAQVSILNDGEVGFGSTEYIVFRAKEGIADKNYLYYLVCSPEVREPSIKSMVGSSGRQRVQTDVVKNLEIDVPPLVEQERIGSFLRLIDDKIALNDKINNNLEQQAEAIFQSILSNAITTVNLGEIADVKGGKRLPKGVNLIDIPNAHPYIRVRDLNNALFASLTPNYAYVDKETQKSISRYIVSTGDVLISIVGTIGLTAIVDSTLDKANLTENCVKVTNLKHITPEYLLLYLRSQLGREAIAKGTVGAVQQKLPIKNIQAIPIPLLSEKDKNALFCTLDSIFAGISNNVIQSAKLASLRDTLLPRLMSGELDVSDIDH
ncbi:MAG: restriction endonuclease subunit S [Ligilactobacillus ruminis]